MESELLNTIGAFVQNIGLPVALVLFFVYWAWKREQALSNRLNTLEENQRRMLEGTIAKNTRAYVENTVALTSFSSESKKNTEVMGQLITELVTCIEKANSSNFKLRAIKGEKQ